LKWKIIVKQLNDSINSHNHRAKRAIVSLGREESCRLQESSGSRSNSRNESKNKSSNERKTKRKHMVSRESLLYGSIQQK
jgi:hypothetical protein